MKLMMLDEFGSTGALAMLVFQRLLVPWKGMKPLRLVSSPGVMPAQVPDACASAADGDRSPVKAASKRSVLKRLVLMGQVPPRRLTQFRSWTGGSAIGRNSDKSSAC